MQLAHKRIVLGLTGGVACYKAAMLCRLLRAAGAEVQVVMTDAASHFITAVSMQALSGQPVFDSQWDRRPSANMAHIDLTRNVDLVLICPCSADFMAKLAHGLCDDLLSTLCVARPRNVPLAIVPAMNVEMWHYPATQRNRSQLATDGVQIWGPDSGSQACGESGQGRMLEPEAIVNAALMLLAPSETNASATSTTPGPLTGKRVLITAGPTFEALDPVRGITNKSSGKMGFAIARAAIEAGADVHLVAGPVHLPTPDGVAQENVISALDMHAAVMRQIGKTGPDKIDLFIAVAAVADWRAAHASPQKIKKQHDGAAVSLELLQNPDILAEVAAISRQTGHPYCVGFAAESENLLINGALKRQRKDVPLLVGNIGPETFGADHNQIILFDEHGHQMLPAADKLTLARMLIADIAKRLSL